MCAVCQRLCGLPSRRKGSELAKTGLFVRCLGPRLFFGQSLRETLTFGVEQK